MAATSALSLSLSPAKRHLLALFALIALLVGLAIPQLTTAHAAGTFLRYHRGYSVQRGWLCYGWANGAYHCTTHWRVIGGRFISLHPSWVPSQGPQPAPAPAPSGSPSGVRHTAKSNHYPWGQCTYGAAALSWDNVDSLGNAKDWLWNARARGMRIGYTPVVGATVVYQPGVQGASGLGHVAHVTAVYAGGRFEVEEMNYYGFGGGFGIFSYRTSWVQTGVGFIY